MRRKKKVIVNIYLHLYGLNYFILFLRNIWSQLLFFFFSNFQLSIIKKRERKVEKINKWDYESGIYKFQIGWAVYDKEEL